jgi:diaminohydroxyphosphoribosylaminopyrimidine deaminase/5-amino-6-(5-phosphoribosylamino)uracil reductase
VSLEPCAHHGKTPPCCDLIIKNKISKVIVGCRDPFVEVDGKGIEKLKAAGTNVSVGLMEEACKKMNKRFLTFHTKKRPYIILKWAQTKNNIIGTANQRLYITGSIANRLVHRWRSEEAAILIGTKTALLDDPQLTNRLWTGNSPVRVVIDKQLSLPLSLKIFDNKAKTIVINTVQQEQEGTIFYYLVNPAENLVQQITAALYDLNLLSVIIEGGAKLLQSFIDAGLWDEARVITNNHMTAEGTRAPVLTNSKITYTEEAEEEISFLEPSYL